MSMLCLNSINTLDAATVEKIDKRLSSFGWLKQPLFDLVWTKTSEHTEASGSDNTCLSLEQTFADLLWISKTTDVIHFIVQAGNEPPTFGSASYPSAEENMKRFR